MTRDVKERLLRLCLASILNSDLSASEIRKASKLFADGEISNELSSHLENFAMNTPGRQRKPTEIDRNELFYDEIREHINRQRLSKDEILKLATNLLGIDFPSNVRKNLSVKEILSVIHDNATEEEFDNFVRQLLNTRKRDPYLSGLQEKDK